MQFKEYTFNILNIDNYNLNNSSLRFWYNHCKKNYNKIDGDLIELGVFNGKSLLSIALLLKSLKSKKKIYGFDSFSGFTNFSKQDHINNFSNQKYFDVNIYQEHKKYLKLKKTISKKKINVKNISTSESFSNVNLNLLKKKIKLLKLNNIVLIKGEIEKTLPNFFKKNKNKKIFSCNLDLDLYLGYKISLPLIYKNLDNKGIIHLDEYFSLKFPGPKIATDNFLKKFRAKIKREPTRKNEFPRYFLEK